MPLNGRELHQAIDSVPVFTPSTYARGGNYCAVGGVMRAAGLSDQLINQYCIGAAHAGATPARRYQSAIDRHPKEFQRFGDLTGAQLAQLEAAALRARYSLAKSMVHAEIDRLVAEHGSLATPPSVLRAKPAWATRAARALRSLVAFLPL